MVAGVFGTVCSVYKPVISRGKVVALSHVAVVIGRLCHWHLRLLELLTDLRWPLDGLLVIVWRQA